LITANSDKNDTTLTSLVRAAYVNDLWAFDGAWRQILQR
jgi:hypothetical protein